MNEGVNVIPHGVNNNVVNFIVNDLFTAQAIIDTGSYLSFLDNSFVKTHKLCVTLLKSGMSRSYIEVGNTRITAIGTTDIVLTFAGEKFPFCFQFINNLFTNILIGMNFITMYDCVPYANKALFTLGGDRITVPMIVKGIGIG